MAYSVLTDGTLDRRTKIGMINRCLEAIGEVPIPEGTNLDEIPIGTDVYNARKVVERTMREVQSRGWYFNIDFDYRLYVDDDGYITLPPNVLRIDSIRDNRFIDRGNRIYDLKNKTYLIKDVPYVEVDIVWMVDYDELPIEAYEYISAKAAREFQEKTIGATELTQTLRAEELEAYVNLQRRQLQTMEYNIQNERVSTRVTNGYLREGLYRIKRRL